MELIFQNWEAIFAALVVVAGLFGGGKKVLPYIKFAKEVGDIYIRYKELAKDGFTDQEYTALGKEVVEAVDAYPKVVK